MKKHEPHLEDNGLRALRALETEAARAAKVAEQASLAAHQAALASDEIATSARRLAQEIARGVDAIVPARPETLAQKIERVLRSDAAPIAPSDLAVLVDEKPVIVVRELQRLRAMKCPARSTEDAPDARQIYNHGTADEPLWAWVPGDTDETSTVLPMIERWIRTRPYTFAELTAATGIRRGRLSGVLVTFQKRRLPVQNVGGDQRNYRWFIGDVRPARRGKN